MTYIPQQKFQTTAFGEQESTPSFAFIEGSASYDLIPANFRTFTATGGNVGTENRMFKMSTGTSVGGYGAVQSFRSIPHRVGKGITGRFSGYFESSVTNSWQGIGFISIGEEISFGYNGADFGVWHRYGGLSEVRTITITGAAGGSTNLTLTLNGVVYTIPLTAGTTQHNAYQISNWLNNNQSVWGADQLNSTVIISALSDGAKSGAYSFSHATATGTIAQNTAGVTKTSDFIAQGDFNGSVFSTFDPTKGNLYQISYQNMGYGEIVYSIMNPSTGLYDDVHRLEYPNSSTIVGVPNPSLRCGAYCVSIGSTTNLNVYVHSFSGFVDGVLNKTRNPRSQSTTATIVGTSETTAISIRNRRTYNAYNNQVEIQPLRVSVANNTPNNAVVRVRSTTTPNVELNYISAGNNLVADYSTTATAFSSGTILSVRTVSPTSSIEIDLEALEVTQPPSLHLIVTIERVNDTGSGDTLTTSITWYEDL